MPSNAIFVLIGKGAKLRADNKILCRKPKDSMQQPPNLLDLKIEFNKTTDLKII